MHIHLSFFKEILSFLLEIVHQKFCTTTHTTLYKVHFIENKRLWIDHEIEAFVSMSKITYNFISCFQSEEHTLKCIHPKCHMVSHTLCLSNKFLLEKGLKNREVLPVDGTCPKCKGAVLWGDLVRLKKGCYQNLEEVNWCKKMFMILFMLFSLLAHLTNVRVVFCHHVAFVVCHLSPSVSFSHVYLL